MLNCEWTVSVEETAVWTMLFISKMDPFLYLLAQLQNGLSFLNESSDQYTYNVILIFSIKQYLK